MALQHVSNFVVFYGLNSTRAVRPSVPSRSVICGGAAVRQLAVDFSSSAETAVGDLADYFRYEFVTGHRP
jgi:hypothetical protein